MKRINVSLRQVQDIDRLDKWAGERGIGRSDALRQILDKFFDQLEVEQKESENGI